MFPSNLIEACLRKVRCAMAVIYIKTVIHLYLYNICLPLSSTKQFIQRVFFRECILVSTIRPRPVKTVRFIFCHITGTGTNCLVLSSAHCNALYVKYLLLVLILLLSFQHLIDHYYYLYTCYSTNAGHHRWGKCFWSVGLFCGLWPHPGQYGDSGKTSEGFI